MLKDRIENYKKIELLRGSKLLVYVTGDRQNAETMIGSDILGPMTNHLDKIGDVKKISLYLYSNGGAILSGWSIVNLIRSFCDDFEVIVPFRCQSTATLIALGSNRIVMTKQGTLGPIDPSTNGLMNPQVVIDGKTIKVPVSVEHVNAYIDMARKDLSIKGKNEMKEIYLKLTDKIFPLTLGEVYKSRSQIQMLAEKLLKYQDIDKDNIPKIISFLCSGSGSHDYTIYRKEAKEDLGLKIEKPNDELYKIIKEVYDDIEKELELRRPFIPKTLLAVSNPAKYAMRRALLESVTGGCDVYKSEGSLTTQNQPNGQVSLVDNKTFEGWDHENV